MSTESRGSVLEVARALPSRGGIERVARSLSGGATRSTVVSRRSSARQKEREVRRERANARPPRSSRNLPVDGTIFLARALARVKIPPRNPGASCQTFAAPREKGEEHGGG